MAMTRLIKAKLARHERVYQIFCSWSLLAATLAFVSSRTQVMSTTEGVLAAHPSVCPVKATVLGLGKRCSMLHSCENYPTQ